MNANDGKRDNVSAQQIFRRRNWRYHIFASQAYKYSWVERIVIDAAQIIYY